MTQTVLVLGSWGFIGSNLLRALDKDGVNIITFNRTENHPLGLTFASVSKSYYGDFQDSKLIEQIFTENNIDTVYHLISTVVPATGSVTFDINSNVLPTINLLDQMVKHKVQKIVYVSSGGAVYGNSLDRHSENSELYPINSYGVMKVTIEKYLFMYTYQHHIKPLVIRLSNPYGPYHTNQRQGFINIALRAAAARTTLEIWGDGENKKDYIFIEDSIAAIIALIKRDAWGEIVNVGSGQEYSLNEIISTISDIYPDFTWQYKSSRTFDTANFALNIDKLKSIVGALPHTILFDGLSKTNQWMLESK
jgi:UDP-glucose 4-epimerase